MTTGPTTFTDLGLTATTPGATTSAGAGTTNAELTGADAAVADAGGCGGGCNCTCGATDSSEAVTDDASQVDVVDGPVTVDYNVLGMTCAHCVSSVSEELFDIEGVQNVAIQLTVGGASTVTVTSAAPLDSAVVEAAVTEAGYDLVGASA